MEANIIVLNGSGGELDIYSVIFPLYALYLMVFLLLLIAPLIVIASLMVIFTILNDNKLKNVNNLLIVNLLVSDLMFILAHFARVVYLSSIYLFDVELYNFCNLAVPITSSLSRGSTLMAIPLAIYRVVSIVCPFSYKEIMTKERIIAMVVVLWVFAVTVSVRTAINYRVVYVASLAACAVFDIHLASIIFVVPEIVCFMLLLLISVYLRYKITKSNQFIHGIQRNASDREKAVGAGRLVEVLMEQVKPTLSVLIAGGMDVLCDLMIIIFFIILNSLSSSAQQLLVQQIIAFGQLYCQSLCRVLCFGLYNKEIREKMFACYPRQSRVIVLNTAS